MNEPQVNNPVTFDVMPNYKIVAKSPNVLPSQTSPAKAPSENKTLWMVISIIAAILIAVGAFVAYKSYVNQNVAVDPVPSEVPQETPITQEVGTQSIPLSVGTDTSVGTATITSDALPSVFLLKYFNVESCEDAAACAPSADPDNDGLVNSKEFELKTDPNNSDSDKDGLSDGDEINIFDSDPTQSHTAGLEKYNDADEVKAGYSPKIKNHKLEAEERKAIHDKAETFKLHEPTIKTLGDAGMALYNLHADQATPSVQGAATSIYGPMLIADLSPDEVLARDTQRLNTMKKIGSALIRYKNATKQYPTASSFEEMYSQIKTFLGVATNPNDPINKSPYVYTYVSMDGSDFVLNYYSETQKQVIKYTAQSAMKDFQTEQKASYDEQRKQDLDSIKSALMLYSASELTATSKVSNVFPSVESYKSVIVPKYLKALPKDPVTKKDYEYTVSPTFETFIIKAKLDDPLPGKTGWMCSQEEECDFY